MRLFVLCLPRDVAQVRGGQAQAAAWEQGNSGYPKGRNWEDLLQIRSSVPEKGSVHCMAEGLLVVGKEGLKECE